MPIYLDYSATTPCRPEAIAKMQAVLTREWGNPSSLHLWGEQAAIVLEEARLHVAGLINATAESVVFTSGGTEANNIALFGTARTFSTPQHLIISAVEHAAVAQPARVLQQQGWQVSFLSVGPTGLVDPKTLYQMLQDNTALISVIYGQSEVGSVQPINTLGAIAHEHGILFHTDAVQAAGRIPIDVSSSPIDLLSLSSHKIYGPQGAGALYVKPGTPLDSLTHGGGQEQSLRPGTQSLPAIAGFGVAANYALQELDAERQRLTQLRELLFQLLADEPGLIPTGDRIHRLPHHVSFCLQSTDRPAPKGRDLVRALSRAGIGISAGSACNSGKTVPSPVLQAMGLDDMAAQSGIRLTLGRQTQRDQVETAAQVLRRAVNSHAPRFS
ncbi:MAG: cysteine desulfurase family protein [Cyanobacteria bacterium P01_F01_bin.42]